MQRFPVSPKFSVDIGKERTERDRDCYCNDHPERLDAAIRCENEPQSNTEEKTVEDVSVFIHDRGDAR